jgi:hypothetical protein
MASAPSQPLTRSKAWTYAGLNQFGFPGLGTIFAGRKAGYVQAALMVIAFGLTLYFVFWYARNLYGGISDPNWDPSTFRNQLQQKKWYAIGGGLLSLISWSWALLDSVQIVREAQKQPPPLPR